MFVIRGGGEIAARARAHLGAHGWAMLSRGAMPGFPVDRLLITQGLMSFDPAEAWRVNYHEVAALCDFVLTRNEAARICVMGSESGYLGSFCRPYAEAKAALHRYVETRPLLPLQQLVAVSPGIISDAGMTTRRDDQDTVQKRAEEHPKRRHVTTDEVVRLIRFLLYEDQGYVSGTVVRINGGRS